MVGKLLRTRWSNRKIYTDNLPIACIPLALLPLVSNTLFTFRYGIMIIKEERLK